MKLNELKYGDIVKTRDGKYSICAYNGKNDKILQDIFFVESKLVNNIIIDTSRVLFFNRFNENMFHKNNNFFDIVKVYRSEYRDMFAYSIGTYNIIYDRESKYIHEKEDEKTNLNEEEFYKTLEKLIAKDSTFNMVFNKNFKKIIEH